MKMFKTFSIKTLLIVTFVVAVGLALPIRTAVLQKRGREWVEQQRGHVTFEHPYDYKNDTHSVPYVPNLLISVLGIDLFNPVRSIMLDCEELDDISAVENFQQLECFAVNIDIAKDLDFSPLQKLRQLKEVHFTQWANISRAQVKALKTDLPNVKVTSASHPDL